MAFDYGAEVPKRGPCYKRWPEEGAFTALLDGDMLPYIVGYTTEETAAVIATRRTMKLLEVDQEVGVDTKSIWWYNALRETKEFMDACDQADWLVNNWAELAEADAAIVFMSGPTNYRDHVAFTSKYKGQRKEEKPPFFYELRTHLLEAHGARLSDGCEADDDMSIAQWEYHQALGLTDEIGSEQHKTFSNCCIVSKDKDLFMVPGWHVDPSVGKRVWVDTFGWLEPVWKDKEVINYEHWPLVDGTPMNPEEVEGLMIEPDTYARGKNKGKVKTKRVECGKRPTQYIGKLKGAGMKFFCAQLLMGDGVDNYCGVPKVGMTAAYDLLGPCKTLDECYEVVMQKYVDHYGKGKHLVTNWRGGTTHMTAFQRMLEQGRLAWMQTEANEVWMKEHQCLDGEDTRWKGSE